MGCWDRRCASAVILFALVMGGLSEAATIQYLTASGVVTAASNNVPPVQGGYTNVTVSGSAAAIQWPLPSGCTTRDPNWVVQGYYQVTNPTAVNASGAGITVRSGVVCFRNRVVTSAAEVDAVVHELITTGWNGLTGGRINDLSVILALVGYVRCLVNPAGSNCAGLQTQANSVNAILGDNATLLTNLTNLNTLLSDAATLKAAQGW